MEYTRSVADDQLANSGDGLGFAGIRSYTATAAKHGLTMFDALTRLTKRPWDFRNQREMILRRDRACDTLWRIDALRRGGAVPHLSLTALRERVFSREPAIQRESDAPPGCGGLRERTGLLRLLVGAGPWTLGALLLVMVVQSLLPAATALATVALLESVGRDPAPALVAIAGVVFVGQACSCFVRPLYRIARARIDALHRARLMELLLSTPTITALESQPVQDLVKAATADPMEWVDKTPGDGALGQLSMLVCWAGLTSTAAVVATWSWWLVPVLILPALIVRRINANMWLRHFRIWAAGLTDNRRSQYWGELTSSPAEAKELRTFGFGPWMIDRRQHHLHAQLDSVWADDLRAVREKWKVLLLAVLPLAAVFVVVAVGTSRGHGSVALLAGVLGASWGVFTSLIGSGDALNVEGARPVVRAASSLRRQLGRHGAPGPDPTAAAHLGRETPPLVHFEGVTFRYPGATSDLLKGLDLEIRPGELLAVVGLNGTGKSTLTKLLAGLYEPDSGRITADGVDLRALDLTGWRRLITIVHQDFVRYALTVRQNVALGKVTACLPEAVVVQAAARDAGLSPVVDRLAAGWDTPLSRSRTGGVDLSGGEWQQVALARALYATRMGARVLVLDEPTAHLDVRTEADLFARLSGITRGVSTVLISHRLSTVRQADRIVLLEDGQIRESGTHDELMALGGGYARMFSLQAERFVLGYDDRVPAGALP